VRKISALKSGAAARIDRLKIIWGNRKNSVSEIRKINSGSLVPTLKMHMSKKNKKR